MWLVLVWRGDGWSGLRPFAVAPVDLVTLAWEVCRLMWKGRPFHIFPVRRTILDLQVEMALFDAFHAMLS